MQEYKSYISGVGVQTIQGKPVDFEGLELFIHRPYGSRTGWMVSEVSTGLQVGKGKTQAAAIAVTVDKIKTVGLPAVLELVAHADKI